jgi:hypothetical protein
VGAIAVQLDDEALSWPETIHNEGAQTDVDLWARKPVATADSQKTGFQLAAGVVGIELLIQRKPEELRQAQSRGELRLGKGASEVTQGPGWRGDGDVVAPRDLASVEDAGAVKSDPLATPAARLSRDRYVRNNVNCGWGRRAANPEHAPELAGARVAQHCPLPTGENRCHPSAGLAYASVPNGENLAVKTVKAAGAQAAAATLAVDSGLVELLPGDHTVLLRCDSGDDGVRAGIGASCMHGDA